MYLCIFSFLAPPLLPDVLQEADSTILDYNTCLLIMLPDQLWSEDTLCVFGNFQSVVCHVRISLFYYLSVVAKWVRHWNLTPKVVRSNSGHGTEELGRSS